MNITVQLAIFIVIGFAASVECFNFTGTWTGWSRWSQCSRTCGPGTKMRTRLCTVEGKCTGGNDRETMPCTDGPCIGPTTPGPFPTWLQWGQWSPCNPTCDFGQRMRSRRCSQPGRCPGQRTDVESCNVPPCLGPTTPGPYTTWLQWGPWSPCNPTCDFGQRTRNRRCSQPGRCPGQRTDVESCNVPPCTGPTTVGPFPTWLQWGPWSPCNPTCDFGQRSRNRRCSQPDRCPGQRTDVESCNVPPCTGPTTPGPFPTWLQWGPWSPCNPTCGSSSQRNRNRVCSTPGRCAGERTQTRSCPVPPCPALGDWSPWGPWSPCSPTCGPFSQRSRNRVCSIPGTCTGDRTQTGSCEVGPCDVQGDWSPWGPWSPCSPTCDFGQRTRNRRCSVPGTCQGRSSETTDCTVPPCPSAASWSPWGPWSPCDPTCGPSSQRSRSRVCSIPGQCTGQRTENRNCQLPPCFEQGDWSPWGPWSPCSPTCDFGQRTRNRRCSIPGTCQGTGSETTDCTVPPCPTAPTWGQWGPWSTCSPTCGPFSTRSRNRFCSTPGQCPGDRTETGDCPAIPCPPVQGDWSPWSPWTECNPTCDFGQRSRNRICSIPGTCPGDRIENENCPVPPCPPLATWSPWSNWSPCNPTCDFGQRMRNRQCTVPGQCQGPGTENEACPVPPCPTQPPTMWLSWGPWSPCSATCGFGEMVRTRQCSTPAGGCFGSPAESQDCRLQPCAQWLEWGPWSECSASCGLGQRTRTRRCSLPLQCMGMNSQMEICNAQACLKWSDWSPWSMCSSSCGMGMDARARACPKDDQCPGAANEMGTCDVGPCPVLSDWTKWSECSNTCGSGKRKRRKVCNSINGCNGLVEERGVCQESKTCRTVKEFIDLVTKEKKMEFTGLIGLNKLVDTHLENDTDDTEDYEEGY